MASRVAVALRFKPSGGCRGPLQRLGRVQMEIDEEDDLRADCSASPEQRLLVQRFYMLGVIGTVVAVFGVIANFLLAIFIFLSRTIYRHSPFFFLGFVALFDTLLDATFLLLFPLEVNAEYYDEAGVYEMWLQFVPTVYIFAQIFKIASVFSLIMASIERYCMTKHWTFVGFEERTRWLVLVALVVASIVIKYLSEEVVIETREHCSGYRHWTVKVQRGELRHMGFVHLLAISLPFFTLIFLNGGIVYMLRKQNVQQLRSLITELTLGHDLSKIRRKNLRSATRTLIVIISAYLISNSLNMLLIIVEYIDADFLLVRHPDLHRLAVDSAALLTVVANAIRCPTHVLSNSEIRHQFKTLFCGENEKKDAMRQEQKKQTQERLDNPWMSLMWVSANSSKDPRAAFLPQAFVKRHSAIAIL
ncbi:unnamed protein product [Caenorhabditis auriculariae]|uniref:G-protein coupled receptors family 1 profile domain-containing protein n=1 Tax=Caenorhabditis auriculariae TaxID=2777116 RepID=A0A8S1H9J1_9PELO|nr:unnamed protein product [Caenorhabditis auriculariae]